jgi:hypothetical protein
MKLQETIKRILNEETQLQTRLRRRIHLIDDEVEFRLLLNYTPKNICRFENDEELLEVIIESSIEAMYFTYFSGIDDSSKEWSDMYYQMYNYINNKYGEKIKEYYQTNCVN